MESGWLVSILGLMNRFEILISTYRRTCRYCVDTDTVPRRTGCQLVRRWARVSVIPRDLVSTDANEHKKQSLVYWPALSAMSYFQSNSIMSVNNAYLLRWSISRRNSILLISFFSHYTYSIACRFVSLVVQHSREIEDHLWTRRTTLDQNRYSIYMPKKSLYSDDWFFQDELGPFTTLI